MRANMNLQTLDQEYILQTYNKDYTHFVRGKNATLYDADGNDYIDFIAGIAVTSVGHANERVNAAISAQLSKLTHISNLFVIEPQANLAQKMSQKLQNKYSTFFCNSGTEANEGAIKIARKYGEVEGEIKRFKIVTLKNSFHGRTITALKATGQEAMHNYFGPFPDGFVYASGIEDISNHFDNQTVAVLVELIQGEGGIETFTKEQVKELAKQCKEKNILLIVDEVQTGIYRTGEFLLSQKYDIYPDIITLAKGLGNGVPIGAIMTTHKDLMGHGSHGSTFGGNFLATTAALEVMSILEEQKTSGELDDTIAYFEQKLDEIQQAFPTILLKKVGVGLMVGFRLQSAEVLTEVLQKAKENRLLMLKAGKNTLRILPSLIISKTEIDEGFNRLQATLSAISQL